MTTCPQCYTGTCKRHKRQDHGKSLIKSANAESTLQKMYDQLVGSKLQKLQEDAKKDVSSQITTAYRKKLDASRDKSMHQKHKKRSKVSSEDLNGSGLNPQALAAINDRDSDVSDDDRRSKKKKKKESGSKRHKRDKDDDSDVSDDSSHDSRRRPKRSSSDRKHRRHSKSNHEKKRHKNTQSK
uniref:Uncharacterized protein n=1 Tax=Peronospora matthiolae TaxID=2874970 RepID=A0AAV1TTA9_9STRA